MERNNLETFLTYAKEPACNKESSRWFLTTMCYENNFDLCVFLPNLEISQHWFTDSPDQKITASKIVICTQKFKCICIQVRRVQGSILNQKATFLSWNTFPVFVVIIPLCRAEFRS